MREGVKVGIKEIFTIPKRLHEKKLGLQSQKQIFFNLIRYGGILPPWRKKESMSFLV